MKTLIAEQRYQAGKLRVVCPNILSSMYAQAKLRDEFGYQILSAGNEPHFTDRFCIVNPPEDYPDDKPVICRMNPTRDQEGNEIYDKSVEYIDLMDALCLLSFIRSGPHVLIL